MKFSFVPSFSIFYTCRGGSPPERGVNYFLLSSEEVHHESGEKKYAFIPFFVFLRRPLRGIFHSPVGKNNLDLDFTTQFIPMKTG